MAILILLCQDTRIKTKVCVYMCGCVCDYCEYLLQSHRHILISGYSLLEYIPEKVLVTSIRHYFLKLRGQIHHLML